jgi:hypothetical protein
VTTKSRPFRASPARPPSEPLRSASHPGSVLLAISAVLLRLFFEVWYFRANLGFPVTFGDDVMQIVSSFLWSRDPVFLPHATLLPLPFWLLGAGFRLHPDPALTPVLLQGILSFLVLCFVWGISREIFREEPSVAALAVAAAALHPASVLFGMGSLQTPYLDATVLAGCFFTLRFHRTQSAVSLWAAATAFSGAALVHYDGWLYALIFCGFIACLSRSRFRNAKVVPISWTAAVLLPGAIVFGWVVLQAVRHGSPLFHIYSTMEARPELSVVRRLFSPLTEFLSRFPVVSVFWIVGWADRIRSRIRFPSWFLVFPIGEALLTVPLYLIGALIPFCHYTHLWTNHLLLLPFAAWGFLSFFGRRRKWAAFVAAGAVAAFGLLRFNAVASSLSDFRPAILQTGSVLKRLWAEGRLPAEGRVLVELHDSERSGRLWETQALFLVNPPGENPFERVWDPPRPSDRIVLDRAFRYEGSRGSFRLVREGNPSSLDKPSAALHEWLKEHRVDLVIAHKEETGRKLAEFMQPAGRIGPYRLWANAADRNLAESAREYAREAEQVRMPWRESP